jgi:ABC-type histidine transport system ATPase subunit
LTSRTRALVLDPTLLILDEPTECIQPNIVHEIGDVIIRLRDAGITVLLVEHKLPFARRVASDVPWPACRILQTLYESNEPPHALLVISSSSPWERVIVHECGSETSHQD